MVGILQVQDKVLPHSGPKGKTDCATAEVEGNAITYIRQLDLPIIIIWASPLSFYGVSGVILNFYSIF